MTSDIRQLIDKILIVRNEIELQSIFEKIKPGNPGRPVRVAFINAHGFNLAWGNPSFLNNLLECDYIFRDGTGMKILFRLMGREAGLNLNGTDLIPRIMDLYKGHDVALLGTTSPYLEASASILTEKGLYPVVVENGFQDQEKYLDAVRAAPVPLIILGMGMPKQEDVASKLAYGTSLSSLIICGGAILDFISGKVSRAPAWMRNAGVEWIYRLWQEPRRLFKRYIFGNILFLMRAWKISKNSHVNTDSLKILHVVRQYAPAIGGLESYVQNMVRHQKSLGHKCEILTLNKVFHGNDHVLPAYETIENTKIHRVSFLGKRRFFIPLVSPWFFRKYNVVHVHNTDFFFDYAGLCSFLCGIPAFATTHGGFFHTQDFSLIKKIYFHTLTRISVLFYKTLFAISRNDEKTFKSISKNIVYLPNAVQPIGDDIFEGPDFLYIGRLAQNKDIPKLIEVFSYLKKKNSVSGRLHIIGPEWDVTHSELRKVAEDKNISHDVILHGACDSAQMRIIARGCGYFVSASSFEGFGMSMLEGMSVGLIPLVHNNEAFTQLVRESGTGLLADFNSPEAAAEAIASYLPKITREDRVRAQKFSKDFSWPDLSEKVIKFYKEAVV